MPAVNVPIGVKDASGKFAACVNSQQQQWSTMTVLEDCLHLNLNI
jgi:hypothetical protein